MFLEKIITFLLLSFFTLLLASDYSQATKEKKIYPMGEKIYTQKCSNINPDEYSSLRNLQEAIKTKQLCKELKDKYFEALSLYLWEVKRKAKEEEPEELIVVTKDEKCPICGMFVYKYPRWASQIFYGEKHYSFDGVKDMMKYYFDNEKGISKILVRDYYSQKGIDGRKAFYVLGSDVYGPMGNELIAFKNEDEAKTFYFDHRGSEILKFDAITVEKVYKLDE